jgi:hypothetical protein
MKKFLLVAAACVAFVSPLHAEAGVVNFVCSNILINPQDRDPDPTYKITVDLRLSDDGVYIVGTRVIHHSIHGAQYVRHRQYPNFHGTDKSNGNIDVLWDGDNQYGHMTGHVFWYNQNWHYTERLVKNGRVMFDLDSICSIVNGE